MKPSQLVSRMSSALFLPGALGNAELEQAAALYIHFCAANGNEWQSVGPQQMGEFLEARIDKHEWRILKAPMFRPNWAGLVAREMATRDPQKAIELTHDTIARCAKSLGFTED